MIYQVVRQWDTSEGQHLHTAPSMLYWAFYEYILCTRTPYKSIDTVLIPEVSQNHGCHNGGLTLAMLSSHHF